MARPKPPWPPPRPKPRPAPRPAPKPSPKPPPKPKPKPTPRDPYAGLKGSQRDIAVALTNLFGGYGLGTLAPKILDFIRQGYSADTVSIMLQESSEYKARFAANDKRRAAGLPVLSPAEYLATERSYSQIMQAAGLPVGFYDRPSDFTDWLSKDVSPAEIQSRVQVATDLVSRSDPATLAYFKTHYTTGDLVAYALDQSRAAPLIEQQYKAAQVGGAASAQGLSIAGSQAELLAKQGVSADQARQGFGFVKDNLAASQHLGAIYGEDISQDDLVQEVFGSDSAAGTKRKTLASKERASFGGSGGQSKTSLSKSTAGAV